MGLARGGGLIRIVMLALVGLIGFVPWAWACPACAPGDGKTRSIYIASTVALSLLPLGLIGLGIGLLRHAARKRDR